MKKISNILSILFLLLAFISCSSETSVPFGFNDVTPDDIKGYQKPAPSCFAGERFFGTVKCTDSNQSALIGMESAISITFDRYGNIKPDTSGRYTSLYGSSFDTRYIDGAFYIYCTSNLQEGVSTKEFVRLSNFTDTSCDISYAIIEKVAKQSTSKTFKGSLKCFDEEKNPIRNETDLEMMPEEIKTLIVQGELDNKVPEWFSSRYFSYNDDEFYFDESGHLYINDTYAESITIFSEDSRFFLILKNRSISFQIKYIEKDSFELCAYDSSYSKVYEGKKECPTVFKDYDLGLIIVSDKVKAINTSITSCTIPEEYKGIKITGILENGFENCKNLKSITIPDSVTSIGDYAFYNCSSLTSINIPESVTFIGDFSFYRCSKITSLIIPNGVTSIGFGAFSDCGDLSEIILPDSIISIEGATFSYCYNLAYINIPNGVTYIGYHAFQGCSKLSNIVIPDSVISIEDRAFWLCKNLTQVTIGNSVTSIGEEAFYSCSNLVRINIPDSVTFIGNNAFLWCTNINEIRINKPKYSISGAPWGARQATVKWQGEI